MSDSPQYEAFRAFARATIALEVVKATQPLQEEIRSLRSQRETRSAMQPVPGPPGPAGKDAVSVAATRVQDGNLLVRMTDGTEHLAGRVVGDRGGAGPPGERGADGSGRDGNGVTVTVSPDAPLERKAGDLWIVP